MSAPRALIVDDEPLARREMRRLLAAHPWLEAAADAGSVAEAAASCARAEAEGRPFDLLLLDVQMPDGSGFDLLERLGTTPEVIFVTAYDQHAVRAFRSDALDYLVKPVDPAELDEALSRFRQRRAGAHDRRDAAVASQTGAARHGRLFVKDGARAVLVPVPDIQLLEAAGDYTRIVYGRPPVSILSARSLAALETLLPGSGFFRANRQQIVNLDHVQELQVDTGSRLVARLADRSEVIFSARRSRRLRESFGD